LLKEVRCPSRTTGATLAEATAFSPARVKWLNWMAICIAFPFFFYFNAYLCDDAFITFRTIDNFVRGYGLRWNVVERVQVFTAPLHTLVMSALYWFTYDRAWLPNADRMYWTSMLFSYGASLGGLLWLASRARNVWLSFPTFLLLMSSQAFVTFTSSGLETPLVYLLVILFYARFLWTDPTTLRAVFWLLLLAALALVNRLDTALLFFPASCWVVIEGYRRFGRRVLRPIALASLPMVAWFGFALVYFGFLLPNSYYAKMGLGVDASILEQMGWAYLAMNWKQDPVTLGGIALGIILSGFALRTLLAGIGSLLYVAYIYLIGGDFIGFRFLAPPFLLATIVICRFFDTRYLRRAPLWSTAAVLVLLLYGSITPSSPLRGYRDLPRPGDVLFYFDASSLAKWRPEQRFPFSRFGSVRSYEHCREGRGIPPDTYIAGGGMRGFCVGPKVHLLSLSGITDPLIARLPIEIETHFLPGHVVRPLPAGYLESVQAGIGWIADPILAAYYEKIVAITQGPLFSSERWRSILELNFTAERRFTRPYAPAVPPHPRGIKTDFPSLVDQLREMRDPGRRDQ
jgi:arabinofuranosyltransferase